MSRIAKGTMGHHDQPHVFRHDLATWEATSVSCAGTSVACCCWRPPSKILKRDVVWSNAQCIRIILTRRLASLVRNHSTGSELNRYDSFFPLTVRHAFNSSSRHFLLQLHVSKNATNASKWCIQCIEALHLFIRCLLVWLLFLHTWLHLGRYAMRIPRMWNSGIRMQGTGATKISR